jgi:hypothetical protein
VAQHFTGLVERSTLSEQLRRQCVAEKMAAFAGRIYARADQCPSGDRVDVRETVNGCPMSKEHMTAQRARACGAQVDCDGFADVRRERASARPESLWGDNGLTS